MVLNRAKDYYKNNKEKLRKRAKNKFRKLSEKEKDRKRKYGRDRYENLSEKRNKNENNIKKIMVRLKKYQKNQRNFFLFVFFFRCIKIRKELVFKIKHNNYTEDKYYFQKDKKKPININEVDIEKNSVI